jgi:hypothetical protein
LSPWSTAGCAIRDAGTTKDKVIMASRRTIAAVFAGAAIGLGVGGAVAAAHPPHTEHAQSPALTDQPGNGPDAPGVPDIPDEPGDTPDADD